MAMSRKHYREVASLIDDGWLEHFDTEVSPQYVQGWMLSFVASGLARIFAADNPNFDTNKFMEACFQRAKEEMK